MGTYSRLRPKISLKEFKERGEDITYNPIDWAMITRKLSQYPERFNPDIDAVTPIMRKEINAILEMKNKGESTQRIAKKLGLTEATIRQRMEVATAVTNGYMIKIPDLERKIMNETVTYTQNVNKLVDKMSRVVDELDENKTYLNPKTAAAFAMIIGELRQTLELGAKLSGELQTGPKVNVLIFSGLIDQIINILRDELDDNTFNRIRERMRLSLQGQNPIGLKGGEVTISDEEQYE